MQTNIACKDGALLGIFGPVSSCAVGVPSTSELPCIEMVHEVSSPLDSCIGKLAYLLTVEAVPASAVELAVEIPNEFGVYEVDKCITHITGVIVIHWQIQEVYLETVVTVDLFKQHLLGILVGDVSDHQGRSSIGFDLNEIEFTL